MGEGYYDAEANMPHPELGADGLPSEHSLLANATRVRLVYEGRWKDIDGLGETGVDGRETCMLTEAGEAFDWVDPCGEVDDRTYDGATCDDPETWVDSDCNPCTPNPAHEGCEGGGCERLIHWYTPPAIETAPEVLDIPEDLAAAGADGALRVVPMRGPAMPPVGIRTVLQRPMDGGVRIYDVAGRFVRDLGTRDLPGGASEWTWDGRDRVGVAAPPGIYFVRALGGGEVASRQVVLLRR